MSSVERCDAHTRNGTASRSGSPNRDGSPTSLGGASSRRHAGSRTATTLVDEDTGIKLHRTSSSRKRLKRPTLTKPSRATSDWLDLALQASLEDNESPSPSPDRSHQSRKRSTAKVVTTSATRPKSAPTTSTDYLDASEQEPTSSRAKRYQAALRRYEYAFKVENGRAPKSEDDWWPVRRTRALVMDGGVPSEVPTHQCSEILDTRPVATNWLASSMQAASSPDELPEPAASAAQKTDTASAFACDAPKNTSARRVSNARLNSLHDFREARAMALLATQKQASARARIRSWFEQPAVELSIIGIVLAYGLFVFVDLGVGKLAMPWWRDVGAFVVDGIFLLFFLLELAVKVVVYGPAIYCSSVLNLVDAFAIVLCALLFLLIDLLGAVGSSENDDENGDNMGAFLVLLRFVRVFRLAAVMLRTLHASQSVRHKGAKKATAVAGWGSFSHRWTGGADDLAAEIETELPGYRGTRGAQAWEQRRREQAKSGARPSTGLSEKAKSLLEQAPPQLVGLLTSNFETLLDLFKELDQDGDGSLHAAELLPGLGKLGLSEETSKALFEALDASNDGVIEVAELFRAGTYLRTRQLTSANLTLRRTGDPRPRVAALRQQQSAAALISLQRKHRARLGFAGCRQRLRTAAKWWLNQRWSESSELSVTWRSQVGTFSGIDRENDELALRMPLPYDFEPGKVSLFEQFDGSGALLESRVESLLKLVDLTQSDVTQLMQKLIEIEIGQPREAKERHEEITTYRTYLKGLNRSLPAARLRLEPFLNNSVENSAWQTIRHPTALRTSVNRAAWRLLIGCGASLLARILVHAFLFLPLAGGEESAVTRRVDCERLFALNTTTAELNNIFNTAQKEALDSGDDYAHLFPSSGCDSSDAHLYPFYASCISPLLGIFSVLSFSSSLFKGNANPTALKQLLTDPRVLIIMLQVITRAGLVTSNMTRFPVSHKVYSISGVGTSLFLAKLLDCLFLPCAIVLFVLMDCLVVTAPRMRCVLALLLLFMLVESVAYSQFSELPSVLEYRADKEGASVIVGLETGLLAMMLGAIISSVLTPRELTFVKLPTGLMDLVLFEAGNQKLKKQQRVQARKNFSELDQEKKLVFASCGRLSPSGL